MQRLIYPLFFIFIVSFLGCPNILFAKDSDGFDYPIGIGKKYTRSNDGDGWYVQNYFGRLGFVYTGKYHPGDDWNREDGKDTGESVKAVSNGVVIDIRSLKNRDGTFLGQGIVIKHTVPKEGTVYSVYIHINVRSDIKAGNEVDRSQTIGEIGSYSGFGPHLHFEIRTKFNTSDWYPNDDGNGYYTDLSLVESNGFIDPLDYIDKHRNKIIARIENQSEVYWLQNGKAYHVLSEKIIQDMSGLPGWGMDKINVYPSDVLKILPRGSASQEGYFIQGSDFLSDSLLIKQQNDDKVFLILTGKKRHIISAEVFKQLGYDWNDIIEVSSTIFNSIPPGDPIIKGVPTITLSLNKSTFTTGDTLTLYYDIDNPGPAIKVDMFAGFIYPDGRLLFFDSSLTKLVPADINNSRTYTPVRTSFILPAAYKESKIPFFSNVLPSSLPSGTYYAFAALAEPGSAQRGSIKQIGDVSLAQFVFIQYINNPPYQPSNPSPANGTTDVSINPTLSWNGGDPDSGDTVTYDVYFGTSSNPSKVSSNLSATSYSPGTLEYSTTYYWKIIATDNHGAKTTGSLWSFTTSSNLRSNTDPIINSVVANPQSVNTDETSTITCNASDPDNDPLTYSWTKTGGSISGSGSTVTWTAPSTSDTYTVTCNVSDGKGGSVSKGVAITVTDSSTLLSITTTSLSSGRVGVSYSETLSATGGKTPYGWSIISGSLPPGLSLSTSGVISGTPTTAGTYITIKVTDSSSPQPQTDSKEFSIEVASNPPTVTSMSPNSGTQGETLNVIITGTNLTGATSVSFGTDITVNNFTIDSATQITASISISSSATTGTRDVSVTTPAGTGTGSGLFTIQAAAAGTLQVTPEDGLISSGPVKGAYNPGAKTYTLSNTGDTSINWTASNTQNWVSLSINSSYGNPLSGSLAGGESITITLSINPFAGILFPGTYSDTVTFTNTTNGNGNTTRSVNLTGTPIPPDVLLAGASNISSTSAQLSTYVQSNYSPTTGWFEWGTTTSYGNTTSAESLGTIGGSMVHTISGLSSNTTYHFRAVAENSAGRSYSYGGDQSFTTLEK